MRKICMLLILGMICWFPYVGHSQTFDLGEINSARYKIYIPADWNGTKVCFHIVLGRVVVSHVGTVADV